MEKNQKNGLLGWLYRVLKGALIGTGAILPGISGGVLCVALGVYRPMMALLSHPIKELKRQWRFFLPILLGFVLGVLLLSRLVDLLFRTSSTPAIWLFVGLILGTMPSLFRESGREGRGKGALVSLVVTFGLALWLFLSLNASGGAAVTPNTLWWLVCGALWGVGLVVPGMSPSSMFIFLGLYQPMSAGIAGLDFSVLLPMAAGLLLTVALLARAMQWLLKKHYAVAMHAVLGFSLASTLAILPLSEPATGTQIALYAACFVLGAAAALTMDRMNRKMEASGEK